MRSIVKNSMNFKIKFASNHVENWPLRGYLKIFLNAGNKGTHDIRGFKFARVFFIPCNILSIKRDDSGDKDALRAHKR